MNNNQIPISIFDSLEKVLRYIVPGLLFIFLVKISFSEGTLEGFRKNIGDTEFYILSPMFGFVIYSIHRMIFLVLDSIYRFKAKITLAESLRLHADRKKDDAHLQNILYYRWAVIHFSLIFSELVFVFSLISRNQETILASHSCEAMVFSIIFFIGGVSAYWSLAEADYKLVKKNANK